MYSWRENDTDKLNVTPKDLDGKYTITVKDIYSIKEREDSHWNKKKDGHQLRPPFPVLTSILYIFIVMIKHQQQCN